VDPRDSNLHIPSALVSLRRLILAAFSGPGSGILRQVGYRRPLAQGLPYPAAHCRRLHVQCAGDLPGRRPTLTSPTARARTAAGYDLDLDRRMRSSGLGGLPAWPGPARLALAVGCRRSCSCLS
jgi:hypothetical protein